MHHYFCVCLISDVVISLLHELLLQLNIVCQVAVPAEREPFPFSAVMPFKRLRKASFLASGSCVPSMPNSPVARVPPEYLNAFLPVACLEDLIDCSKVFIRVKQLRPACAESSDSRA